MTGLWQAVCSYAAVLGTVPGPRSINNVDFTVYVKEEKNANAGSSSYTYLYSTERSEAVPQLHVELKCPFSSFSLDTTAVVLDIVWLIPVVHGGYVPEGPC